MRKGYFIITAPSPLVKGVPWGYILHLLENHGVPLKLEPTETSKVTGTLVYHVPDNDHNRGHIEKFYPGHIVTELSDIVKVEAKSVVKKPNPLEVKKLKSEIKEKLDTDGIKYSETDTLKVLQEKASQAN